MARELRFSARPDRALEVGALYERPRGATAVYVLAHGAGAGMTHAFMESMTAELAANKIATLRFHFPYTEAGKKRPDPAPTLKSTIRQAVVQAKSLARGLPIVAGGKSMGGRMTSLAAADEPLPEVAGLVFLGFPLHAAGKPGRERGEHLQQVDLPMLFVQGSRDKLADLSLLRPTLSALGKRATLHVIDQGDHSLHVPKRSGRTDDEVRREVASLIAETITQWTG